MTQGSIILKLLVVVFGLVLWQVISIPGKLWKEEAGMEEVSRRNLNTLYEAQNYFYSKNKAYIPSDSLENLLTFIRTDSSLQEKQKIGELTHILVGNINQILNVPVISAISPLSKSIGEISEDLDFNARYFVNFENLVQQRETLKAGVNKFNGTIEFPNFCEARAYVDSLNFLKESISDYTLQNATLKAQRYIDSLKVYVPQVEVSTVEKYWGEQVAAMNNFIKDIRRTNITSITSVDDRIETFAKVANEGMDALTKVDLSKSNANLDNQKAALDKVHNSFITDNFLLTQRRGILQLSEADSVLVKFDESYFECPDRFDGDQRYLVLYEEGKPSVTIESPNLLDQFNNELLEATNPISNVAIYPYVDQIRASLDSTAKLMDSVKTKYRLSRYSTEMLLNLKEVTAEMQDLSNVRFFRYVSSVKDFVDTVKTEKAFSRLKPMIENVSNQFDTLAARVETGNIRDLEDRLNYFGTKIQNLDSLIANNSRIPARSRNQIQPFYDTYQSIFGVVQEMKGAFDSSDGDKFRQARETIDEKTSVMLNGYEEPVYGVFYKKHKNHGFVQNGQKSWEQ